MKKWTASKIMLMITIVQFICTITFYWFSFQKFSEKDSASETGIVSTIEKDANRINSEYKKTSSQYEKVIDSLNNRLLVTDIALKKEISISQQRKWELEELLSQHWDSLSTEQRLSDCDSLRNRTAGYIITEQSKDSLYGQKILELTAINESTQKQLQTCDTTNQKLNDQINVALIHSRQCEEQIRKLKRRNRILKIGAGVIAVFTIGFALK